MVCWRSRTERRRPEISEEVPEEALAGLWGARTATYHAKALQVKRTASRLSKPIWANYIKKSRDCATNYSTVINLNGAANELFTAQMRG